MPSIKVKENEPFDIALRRFRRLCDRAGVITDVRKKEFFEKPTWVNKRKKAAAVKRTHKEMAKNRIHRKRMYQEETSLGAKIKTQNVSAKKTNY